MTLQVALVACPARALEFWCPQPLPDGYNPARAFLTTRAGTSTSALRRLKLLSVVLCLKDESVVNSFSAFRALLTSHRKTVIRPCLCREFDGESALYSESDQHFDHETNTCGSRGERTSYPDRRAKKTIQFHRGSALVKRASDSSAGESGKPFARGNCRTVFLRK